MPAPVPAEPGRQPGWLIASQVVLVLVAAVALAGGWLSELPCGQGAVLGSNAPPDHDPAIDGLPRPPGGRITNLPAAFTTPADRRSQDHR